MDKSVVKKYIDSQKNKAVEMLDFDNEKIKYSDLIKQHREIKNFKGNEEIVRAYLLSKLSNELGYKLENIEIEKEYNLGRPKTNKPRIDLIVRDDEGNAFLYIEVKGPNEFEKNKDEVIEKQLFGLASQEKGQGKNIKYLVLYSIDVLGEKIKDKVVIIDYEKYPSFDKWEEERNFTDELPKRYGNAQKEPYKKGGKKDLRTDFANEELEAKRKNLHNVLWGGGGTDDNDIFSSLVNIILAKIQDERERKNGEKYQFQIFSFQDGGSFESNEEIFERINKLYRRSLKEIMYMTDEKEINESFIIDKKKFSLNKLKYTIQELEEYSFIEGRSSLGGRDILGQFFEGIVRDGFKQNKGQFFTHSNIIKFILYTLQLDKLAIEKINKDKEIPYLIDPSAGSGTFLIEYMNFITENIKRKYRDKLDNNFNIKERINDWMPDGRENKWAKDFIYGIEHNFNLGTASKVNMVLHGDGSTNIFVKDGLLPFNYYKKENGINILKNSKDDEKYFDKSINGKFDIVITNPPFSVDLDKDTKKTLKDSFVFGDKKNSENLFVERWYQLLKENGRLGVVLPESVFDTAENKYIRLFLYKYFKIKAVVSLPQLAFQPYTSTKTSLLFAQKKTKKEIEKWNELWATYSNDYNQLKTRAEKEVEHFIKGKEMDKKWAIYKETEKKRKDNILRLLINNIDEDDKNLSLQKLVEKYQDEIIDLLKIEKETDVFGFVNAWWVFGNVSKELDYSIFMAEVENIGYKRTTRGEKTTSNDLFRVNKEGGVIIDDVKKETALDFIRSDVIWD